MWSVLTAAIRRFWFAIFVLAIFGGMILWGYLSQQYDWANKDDILFPLFIFMLFWLKLALYGRGEAMDPW